MFQYVKKHNCIFGMCAFFLKRMLYVLSNQVGPMFFKIFTKCHWATLFEIQKLVREVFQMRCLNIQCFQILLAMKTFTLMPRRPTLRWTSTPSKFLQQQKVPCFRWALRTSMSWMMPQQSLLRTPPSQPRTTQSLGTMPLLGPNWPFTTFCENY